MQEYKVGMCDTFLFLFLFFWYSFQQLFFTLGLETAFTGRLKVTVEDVHIVMDYVLFLEMSKDTS